MATYTTFEREALERYLVMFDLGQLTSYTPIADGIENSNYFLCFDEHEREFVLTITEDLGFEEVPFFNDLLRVLVNAGLPVPEPQPTLDGMTSTIFKGKPTWLFNRLPGSHPNVPSEAQCHEIGEALGRLHAHSESARYTRDNVYDQDWAATSLAQLTGDLGGKDLVNLKRWVELYQQSPKDNLPRGIVHGDLFRDNALFEGERLTGVIDFYHACEDFLIQDIAITINDWCCSAAGDDPDAIKSLIKGYESVRKLEAAEMQHLNRYRAFGAMRFALTRLLGGRQESTVKNPREFLQLLDRLQSATEGMF